jgi:hypothetical protein
LGVMVTRMVTVFVANLDRKMAFYSYWPIAAYSSKSKAIKPQRRLGRIAES